MATQVKEMVEQVVVADLPRWVEAHPKLRARLREAFIAEESASPLQVTYEDFLNWVDEDTLIEWEAIPDHEEMGVLIMTSPASNKHQDIARFLTSAMSIYVETHQLGVVRPAPFQMKLEHSGREPDLLFVAQEHLGRLREVYLDGPADLVVEIISPESVQRDRGTKFIEYEANGVPEYWLLDPIREWAEFYQLEAGRYRLSFQGREGEYHSEVLNGFWLHVEWLWQETLPAVEEALLEIGGEAYARKWIARLRAHGFLAEDEQKARGAA